MCTRALKVSMSALTKAATAHASSVLLSVQLTSCCIAASLNLYCSSQLIAINPWRLWDSQAHSNGNLEAEPTYTMTTICPPKLQVDDD